MRRFFGRRDQIVFVLLWFSIVWTVHLFGGDPSLFDDEELMQAPTRFLLGILGPGLIILGAASGLERYWEIRRRGKAPTVRAEGRSLGISFLLAYGCLVGGILLFWQWADANMRGFEWWSGYYRWCLIVSHPPFGLSPVPSDGPGSRGAWDLLWLPYSVMLPWIGWVIAYRWSRSSGRFAVPIVIMIPAVWVLGWVLREMISFLARGETSPLRNEFALLSAQFFANLAFLTAGLIALDVLVGLWLQGRNMLKWRWVSRGMMTALMVGILIRQGGVLLRALRPWPPRPQVIEGLDPRTGLLWAWCGSGIYNLKLYGIRPGSGPFPDTGDSPQSLTEIGVHAPRIGIEYLPSLPAILVTSGDSSGANTTVELRTADRVANVPLGPGEWLPYSLGVVTPDPEWFAWLDRKPLVSMVRREDGSLSRELHGRLFLFCPETGERKYALTDPVVSATNTKFWEKPDDPFLLLDAWSGGGDRTVPARIGGREEDNDIRRFCADGFLLSASPPMKRVPLRMTLNPRPGLHLTFDMFAPRCGYDLQEVPAPLGDRGYVWEAEKGILRIYDAGRLAETEVKGPVSRLPSWSPDGEYLVYLSDPSNEEPAELALVFPKREANSLALGSHWSPGFEWSSRSDWVAVSEFGYGRLLVVTVPDFNPIELSTRAGGDSLFAYSPVQPLHDGSLVYIEEGKVFQWRPEWEEPVCIYDAERQTVLKRTDEL